MKQLLLLASTLFFTASFAQKSALSDTISLTINEHNTMYIKAVFNEKDTLNLNFDTKANQESYISQ